MVSVEYVLINVEFLNFKVFVCSLDILVILGGCVIYKVVFYLM